MRVRQFFKLGGIWTFRRTFQKQIEAVKHALKTFFFCVHSAWKDQFKEPISQQPVWSQNDIPHQVIEDTWKKGHSCPFRSSLRGVTTSHLLISAIDSQVFFFFIRGRQEFWKSTLLTGSLTVDMHYNNPINITGLNDSEYVVQCCYSENTGRVEQTGWKETKKESRKREGRWNNNKVRGGGRREDRWGGRGSLWMNEAVRRKWQ